MLDKYRFQCMDSATAPTFTDRSVAGQQLAVITAAGGGAGQTVSTVITFTEPLPASYQVIVSPKLAVVWWITSPTTFGFTVNIAPLLAATTLGASTVDVLVIGI
jgi:hypothetical protein